MRTRVVCETVTIVALGLWAGALALVGVAAAIAFPMMKDLDPTLPAYALYDGDHWRIAAGSIMNTLFGVVDDVGFVAIVVSLIGLAMLMSGERMRRTRLAGIRVVLWVLLAVLSMYIVVFPRADMNELAEQHWTHASAGENDEARAAREAFDELHHTASALHVAQFLMVTLALGVNAAGAAWGPRPERA